MSPLTIYRADGTRRGVYANQPRRVASLPSGVDGLEVYYAADDANGIVWHLRYNAASLSAYKWERVGGPPLEFEALVPESFNSFQPNVWGGIGANDPKLTVPLAGDYLARATITLTTTVLATWYLGLRVGATDASIGSTGYYYCTSAQLTGGFPVSMNRKLLAVPAGTVVQQRYQHNGASAANAFRGYAYLELEPLRVG